VEEKAERRPPPGPSLVEELMTRTRQFLAGMVADYAKRSVDDLLRWVLGRATRYAVSAALFIMAAAFLLLGGARGLIVTGLPPYLAYLIIGATSLLAGVVTLKCCAPACGTK
jgi:hypothetical protein